MTLRVIGGTIVDPSAPEVGDVEIVGENIVAAGQFPLDGVDVIDATDLLVGPGFIDLQINGGFGIDLATDPSRIWELGILLTTTGVTAFLPTIITSPARVTAAALEAIASRPDDYGGAEPLGLHFEGPMLNPARPGAHPVEHLTPPSPAVIESWSRQSGVAMVTLAPELSGASQVITELASRGVVIAAGHSDADAEQMSIGRTHGIAAVTHLFNAMAPFGHRSPNIVGTALADPTLVATLIVDGIHVDPVAVEVAWRAKGPEGLALVTDAVAAMGQSAGSHRFAGAAISSGRDGVRTTSGILAGSDLSMDRAVRNLCAFTGCSPSEAWQSASATPARLLGEIDRGHVDVGAIADLVLLDQDLVVQATICRGVVAYVAEGAEYRVTERTEPEEERRPSWRS